MFAEIVCVTMPNVNADNTIAVFGNCNTHVPLSRKQLKEYLLEAIDFTNT